MTGAQADLLTASAGRSGAMTPGSPLRAGWLHVCNGLDPRRDGGMVPSILGMTGALARGRDGVRIVTTTPSRLGQTVVPPGLSVEYAGSRLAESLRSAEVVHLHGVWQAQTRVGAAAARRARVPYLVAAHGMVDPWALRHKKWKKRLYLAMIESRNLRAAACLHALSRPEIGHLRALAPRTPIGFVPNGVDLQGFDSLPPRSELEQDHPELRDKFVVLFYGRLHAKKGLDLLSEAIVRVASGRPELHLLFAGTDEGAWNPFRARMEGAGLLDRITYLGHCSGQSARRAWAAADAFVLPSHSEGFSMAILEAMACRLPCLITTACHFAEAAAADAAIVVAPTVETVTQGLRALLELRTDERAALGRNGRRLVEREYTWEKQADRLASIYGWLSGGGPAPDCVER